MHYLKQLFSIQSDNQPSTQPHSILSTPQLKTTITKRSNLSSTSSQHLSNPVSMESTGQKSKCNANDLTKDMSFDSGIKIMDNSDCLSHPQQSHQQYTQIHSYEQYNSKLIKHWIEPTSLNNQSCKNYLHFDQLHANLTQLQQQETKDHFQYRIRYLPRHPEQYSPDTNSTHHQTSCNYDLTPSIKQMTHRELSQVHNFTIGNQYGSIKFLQPMNLINKKIEECVQIKQDEIEIKEGSWEKKKMEIKFVNFGEFTQQSKKQRMKIMSKMEDFAKVNGMKVKMFNRKNGDLTLVSR